MCRFPHLIALLLWCCGANAQLTGHVDVPALGFAFDIPPGWSGMEREGTWGLVNDSVPGTVIIATHQHRDLKALEQDMTAVPDGDPANTIHQVGPVRHPLPNGIELDFQGTMEWQPVWIGAVGLISDAGGPGLSIVALGQGTEPVLPLLEAAMGIVNSVRFVRPFLPPVVERWRSFLSGTRLTYLAAQADTRGDGQAVVQALDLCTDGNYLMESATDLRIIDADASLVTGTGSGDRGTWEVRPMGLDGVRLVLLPLDGGERTYALEDSAGATFLNGQRWFRTTFAEGEHAPHCGR